MDASGIHTEKKPTEGKENCNAIKSRYNGYLNGHLDKIKKCVPTGSLATSMNLLKEAKQSFLKMIAPENRLTPSLIRQLFFI